MRYHDGLSGLIGRALSQPQSYKETFSFRFYMIKTPQSCLTLFRYKNKMKGKKGVGQISWYSYCLICECLYKYKDLCTLFPKRNATLIYGFFMVTLDQGQWPWVMCTKWNAPGEEFWNGVFGKFLQNCRNDVWPKVHWPTLFPKRKANSENLRFFWGRVYKQSL